MRNFALVAANLTVQGIVFAGLLTAAVMHSLTWFLGAVGIAMAIIVASLFVHPSKMR